MQVRRSLYSHSFFPYRKGTIKCCSDFKSIFFIVLILKVGAMAFFRKAGNILNQTLSKQVNHKISTSLPSIFQAIRCMSSSKLFVGGLSFSTDDSGLTEAFSKYGEVAEARVIFDRETGRSKGFGFVTFSTVEDASAAIQALDQQDLHGRRVRVDYANDRTRGYGGGGGGFRSGGYGGGDSSYAGNYGSGSGGGYGGNFGGGAGGEGGYTGGGNLSYGGDGQNYGNSEGGHSGGGNPSYGDNGQNFGGAVGGGGSYASNTSYGGGNLSSGFDNFSADAGVDAGSTLSKTSEGAYGHDDSAEGSYKDDDVVPGNYADRRG